MRQYKEVYAHDGYHWNEFGHRLVGEQLIKALRVEQIDLFCHRVARLKLEEGEDYIVPLCSILNPGISFRSATSSK